MARKKKWEPEPFGLSELERDILHAGAMIQVERYSAPGVASVSGADRWREIATAIRNGRPLVPEHVADS